MKEQQMQDTTKMEFLLTLNDNIIVQRFYNVKGYNPKARKSLEVAAILKEVAELVENNLKIKSLIYMIDNQDQIITDPEILETSNTEGAEYFNLYVRIGEETICHRIVDAKLYPPKVRYTVDIRPELKTILRGLTDIFSAENLSYKYMNYQLA
jgi:hypothetical protein